MTAGSLARKTALYGLAALLAVLTGLFVWFPARVAALALPTGVTCDGATGTLWNGRCADLRIRNASSGAVAWQLRKWPLLRGQAQGVAEWTQRGSRLASAFDTSRRGVDLDGLRGVVDVGTARALPFWPQGIVAVWPPGEGRLRIDLDSLEIRDGQLVRIVGVMDADGLVSLDRERAVLGDHRLVWREGPSPLGELSDRGGPLELQARLRPLAGGVWQLDGTVRARDPAWRPRLMVFGPPDASGRHRLSVEWR